MPIAHYYCKIAVAQVITKENGWGGRDQWLFHNLQSGGWGWRRGIIKCSIIYSWDRGREEEGGGGETNTVHNISKIATSLFHFATATMPNPVFKRYLFSLCLSKCPCRLNNWRRQWGHVPGYIYIPCTTSPPHHVLSYIHHVLVYPTMYQATYTLYKSIPQ